MTGEPPRNYTDLDLLKQLTAQGLISAAAIDKVLSRVAEQSAGSADKDIELAIGHAKVLLAHLITAQTARVVRSDDPDHYSDGRPVVGTVDAGGQEYKHVWYADPDDPHNHPAPDQAALATVSNSTGRVFQLFIAEPHKLATIELGDEERDRL
jgi:hypothetical protein